MAAKNKASPARPTCHPLRPATASLNFAALVDSIRQVHEQSAALVNRTVNTTLTLRNWMIGAYIREYEQRGADRAKYGEAVIEKLAERLRSSGVSDLTPRYLRLCRQLAAVYPEIWRSLTAKSAQVSLLAPIWRSLAAKSPTDVHRPLEGTTDAEPERLATGERGEAPSPKMGAPMEKLVSQLSFTHLEQLIAIDDPLKRAFYEIECIRGNWSVRELKRQIATLYFERSGLSKNKKKLAEMVAGGVERGEPHLSIRDPYIFEFLGLRAKDAVAESDLEAALVEHLRDFLLELGHGFCLEAQQKSILIGQTRGFVDLVFYHRLLKCHVLVELKVDEFKHEHLGQLNTYVEWYRQNIMSEGDNPPVGLLLCTDKDQALVEYATAAVGNRLFVSKYAVELPSKKALEDFLRKHRKELSSHA